MPAMTPDLTLQLREAENNGARAALLLQMPYGLFITHGTEIARGCHAVCFALGCDYVEAVTAMVHAVRQPDGTIPDTHRALVDGHAQMLAAYLTASDATMRQMQGRYDAKRGLRDPDLTGDADYEAGRQAVGGV